MFFVVIAFCLFLSFIFVLFFRFGGTAFTLKALFSGISQSFYTQAELQEVRPLTYSRTVCRISPTFGELAPRSTFLLSCLQMSQFQQRFLSLSVSLFLPSQSVCLRIASLSVCRSCLSVGPSVFLSVYPSRRPDMSSCEVEPGFKNQLLTLPSSLCLAQPVSSPACV